MLFSAQRYLVRMMMKMEMIMMIMMMMMVMILMMVMVTVMMTVTDMMVTELAKCCTRLELLSSALNFTFINSASDQLLSHMKHF